MIVLDILLTAFVLLALFITGSVIRQWRKTRKYTKLLDKYREEYASYSMDHSMEEVDNVYDIEEYRNRKKKRMGDDVFEYSKTHNLIWSEEEQKYIRILKNIPAEDE
jgi:hypothetical protein